jgi:hypothetical protein
MTQREGTRCIGDDPAVLTDNVVRELRRIDHRAGWERTVAVGEAVINSFFDGDCRSFRTSPRRAHQSLRCIASHSGCPLKKSALANAVHVYAFVVEHPEVRELEHVLPGHVAAVLKCEAGERYTLLKRVQTERPTVKAFSKQVAMRGNRPRPMKASALPAAGAAATTLKALRSVEGELDCVAERLSRPNSWLSPKPEAARSALARLEESFAKATAAVSALQLAADKRHALGTLADGELSG